MKKELIQDLAWGGGILILALCASYARSQGFIDHDTTTRIVIGATGLMVAWFGNRMPKRFVSSERARKAQRVGGWSLAVSGLIYAGLWAFAPLSVALWVGCAAIIAGMAVTLGYCLWLRDRARTA
jgi:hypothetical protein